MAVYGVVVCGLVVCGVVVCCVAVCVVVVEVFSSTFVSGFVMVSSPPQPHPITDMSQMANNRITKIMTVFRNMTAS